MKFIILAIFLLCILLFILFLFPKRNGNKKGMHKHFDWKTNSNKSIFSIVDTIEYVILENPPGDAPRNIDKVIEKNEKYYVFDYKNKNRIFVYDLSGKFLFFAGGKTDIAGKPSAIRNFTVSRDHIYLLDNDQNTLVILDAKGNFVTRKDLPFPAQDIAVCSNGNFIFSWHPLPQNDLYNETHKIIITDPNIQVQQRLFPVNASNRSDLGKTNFLTATDTVILYHTLYSDSVAVFNGQTSEFMHHITLNFQEESLPIEQEDQADKATSYRYLLNTPGIVSHYLIGNVYNKGKVENYVYNTVTQEVYQNRSKSRVFMFTPICYHEGRITACLPSPDTYGAKEAEAIKMLPPEIQANLKAGKHILINYHLK